MNSILLLEVLLVFVLLGGSAFFSGSETALFGLSRMKRKALESCGEDAATKVLELLKKPRTLLITILLGNTFVNVALSALGTTLASEVVGGERGLGLAIFAVTLLLLMVGEVLPKVLAVRFGEAFSMRVAPGMSWLHRTLLVVTKTVEAFTQAFLRRLPHQDQSSLDEDELVTLLKIGEEGGAIASGEAELVEGILALRGTEAREVMTPRVELQGLCWSPPPDDLVAEVRRRRRQILPLYGKDLDDLVGVLEARAFLLAGEDARVEDFVVQPYLIPEGKTMADLLEDFRERGLSYALVLDEYGGLSGLVTLEDVLEEIFGEVYDRGEVEETEIRPIPGGFRILGHTVLDDVEEELGVTFEDDDDEEVTTLAGFVLSRLGRLARRGDVVVFDGWRFLVSHVLRRRVVSLDAYPVNETSGGEA